MSFLRYRVLGPVEVVHGEDPVRLPSGHQRAVLACLLVHAGHPVPADVLIEAAWPASLPEDPRGALHTVLSRLRTTLGDGAITSSAGSYQLAPEPGAVDAHRVEQLREQARTAGPEAAVELLEAARGLWRGPAYAEHADLDFATAEASRLDRLRSDCEQERAVALTASGRPGDAATCLEELLAEDPFREHAVELLMTALYGAGRPADALAAYGTYRDRLADELGLDPGPTLTELQARILGRDMPPRPGAGLVVPGSRTVPTWADTSTAFFGREQELSDLDGRVARSPLVTVVGVGGVGKTRLVAEALPQLVRRCGPAVVVELATAGPGQVALRLARALGMSGSAGSVEEDITELLGAARMLLVLDNCEHLREETAALAVDIGRRCPQVRIVATSRHRLDVAMEQVLPLEPFADTGSADASDPAMRLFADRLTRVRPNVRGGSTSTVRLLCRRLDGLPLAIELAAARSATIGVEAVADLLVQRPGRTLPELDAVVDWSVRLLTARQRDLLGQLAVFAGSFDRDAVWSIHSRLAPAPSAVELATDLAELVDAHLVVRRGDDGGAAEFGMLAIVRARAEQLLEDAGQREQAREAHARWVAELMRRGARDWSGGATAAASRRLTTRVPDVSAAVRWALRAGQLDVAADVVVPFKLHLHWVSDPDLSDLVVDAAESCAARPGAGRAAAVAAGSMACAERGLIAPAQRLARRALGEDPPAEGRVLAGIAMAVSSLYAGDLDQAARWARGVVDLPTADPGHRADAGVTLALARCYAGDIEEAGDAVRLALLGAQAAGAEAAHAFALYADGELVVAAEPARAAALFRAATALAADIDAQHISQVARLALCAVLMRTGQQAEVLDLAQPLLHDIRRAGAWPQAWTMVRLTAELLLDRGRHAESALLFGAADIASGAPPLIEADIARGFAGSLRDALGADAVRGITQIAASLSRKQVLDRTAVLLAEERRSARCPASPA